MRLNAAPSVAISFVPVSENSGMAKSPVLTESAERAMVMIGRTIIQFSITLSTTNRSAKTANRHAINVTNARFAFSIGTDIGTETTCAPMTSFIFHPKPLASPYSVSIDRGAAAGVLWHTRHSPLATWIGRAMKSERPVGVSRSPITSFVPSAFLKAVTISVSQSVARLRGLVGFSVASL